MMRPLLILLILSVAVGTRVIAEVESNRASTRRRFLKQLDWQNVTLIDCFQRIARRLKVPIGLELADTHSFSIYDGSMTDRTGSWSFPRRENRLGDTDMPRFSVSLDSGSVEDLLDMILERCPQYVWTVSRGVINIYPKSVIEDRDYVLNQVLEKFTPNQTWAVPGPGYFTPRAALNEVFSELTRRLGTSPSIEISYWHSSQNAKLESSWIRFSPATTSVREILNEVTYKSRCSFWSYAKDERGQKNVHFGTWSLSDTWPDGLLISRLSTKPDDHEVRREAQIELLARLPDNRVSLSHLLHKAYSNTNDSDVRGAILWLLVHGKGLSDTGKEDLYPFLEAECSSPDEPTVFQAIGLLRHFGTRAKPLLSRLTQHTDRRVRRNAETELRILAAVEAKTREKEGN